MCREGFCESHPDGNPFFILEKKLEATSEFVFADPKRASSFRWFDKIQKIPKTSINYVARATNARGFLEESEIYRHIPADFSGSKIREGGRFINGVSYNMNI